MKWKPTFETTNQNAVSEVVEDRNKEKKMCEITRVIGVLEGINKKDGVPVATRLLRE